MSYDLMVFDPAVAPRDREAFMKWYRALAEWNEPRDYADPEGMSGNLRAFYDAMRREFPPMNGPHSGIPADPERPGGLRALWARLVPPPADPGPDEACIADYSCAAHAIYLSFGWSVAEQAFERTVGIAHRTGVGVFDPGAEEDAIHHDPGPLARSLGL